jgi:predicted enzyme related to lactoylglutathione lyase
MNEGNRANIHTHGRFVWHDLVSYDRPASVAFFTKLFGWKTRGEDAQSADYVHFLNNDVDLGGAPKREKDPHTPPHWLGYVTVDDVAASAERVKKLGGQVFVGPMHIERVGTFAVIADPTGGVVSLFRSDESETPDTGAPAGVGNFCWNELMSTDPEKAAAFYSEVLGWSWDSMDMGPMGTYRIAKRNGGQAAGLMKTPLQGGPGHSYWLNYVAVENVDGKTKEAESLGGKVVQPPMDIPNIGRASVLQDPTGVHFALFQPAPRS